MEYYILGDRVFGKPIKNNGVSASDLYAGNDDEVILDANIITSFWFDDFWRKPKTFGNCTDRVNLQIEGVLHNICFKFSENVMRLSCEKVIDTTSGFSDITISIPTTNEKMLRILIREPYFIDFHSIFKSSVTTTIFIDSKQCWEYQENEGGYVSFPEGFCYEGIFYNNNILFNFSLEGLTSEYILFGKPQTRISQRIFERHKNVITSFSADKIQYCDNPMFWYEPQIRKLQKSWKTEVVTSLLSADLYEDDEYSWK
jgi:hypothetical protein